MNNRKARLLLKVPAAAIGDVGYYNLTRTRRLVFIGMDAAIVKTRANVSTKKRAQRLKRNILDKVFALMRNMPKVPHSDEAFASLSPTGRGIGPFLPTIHNLPAKATGEDLQRLRQLFADYPRYTGGIIFTKDI